MIQLGRVILIKSDRCWAVVADILSEVTFFYTTVNTVCQWWTWTVTNFKSSSSCVLTRDVPSVRGPRPSGLFFELMPARARPHSPPRLCVDSQNPNLLHWTEKVSLLVCFQFELALAHWSSRNARVASNFWFIYCDELGTVQQFNGTTNRFVAGESCDKTRNCLICME